MTDPRRPSSPAAPPSGRQRVRDRVDQPQFHEPDGDVVPGDPPVPITVWHLPRPVAGQPVPAPVVRRLIANYTSPGAVVVDLTAPAQARQPGSPPGHGRRPADLIVSNWPLEPGVSADAYLGERAWQLAVGGCLAVVLSVNDTPDHLGGLVLAARTAGLTYLQHVVLAHRLDKPPAAHDPQPDDGTAGRRPAAAHLRVHTDVLVFRQPGPDA